MDRGQGTATGIVHFPVHIWHVTLEVLNLSYLPRRVALFWSAGGAERSGDPALAYPSKPPRPFAGRPPVDLLAGVDSCSLAPAQKAKAPGAPPKPARRRPGRRCALSAHSIFRGAPPAAFSNSSWFKVSIRVGGPWMTPHCGWHRDRAGSSRCVGSRPFACLPCLEQRALVPAFLIVSRPCPANTGCMLNGTDDRAGLELEPGLELEESISIQGAREHNLKNLSLEIPRGKFVVVTGVSGSGKSTLAFDLLFAEGQRRFLDSMNAYARQFVEQLARPDVDLITGLPPTVSIEQRTTRGGGKSTVATVTEVYHFLRLLFAKLGTQYCPDCDLAVAPQTRDHLAAGLRQQLKKRGDLLLLAPVVRNRKGFHGEVAEWAAKHGYKEIRADGKLFDTAKPFRLDRFKEHDVEIVTGVLDRKAARGHASVRRIEETLELGRGTLFALDNHSRVTVHSTERACPKCARSFSPLDPKNFSYNSAQGWCPRCRGFGALFYLPDVDRGANADAIEESWWSWASERETCPECLGARLKPDSRAVHLDIGFKGLAAGKHGVSISEFSSTERIIPKF